MGLYRAVNRRKEMPCCGPYWRRWSAPLKLDLERMRIDVIGRHDGADQGIGENVREGEAVRAFLASAVGKLIYHFFSCRTAI